MLQLLTTILLGCCSSIIRNVDAADNNNNKESLLLFVGESNMIGHSSDAESLTGDDSLQNYLFDTWLKNPDQDQLKQTLEQEYQNYVTRNAATIGPNMNVNPQQLSHVADYESKLLEGMVQTSDLSEEYKSYHGSAKCMFVDPSGRTVGQSAIVPVSPSVNCGSSFGYELSFAHSLKWETESPFAIVKVAAPDTRLLQDWMPPAGLYWDQLNRTIHSTAGIWQGFIFNQGISDAMGFGGDTTLTYQDNLIQLMSIIREEIGRANPGKWGQKPRTDIPIAIIDIGAYPPTSDPKTRVTHAHKQYCNDPTNNAVRIRTDDLTPFEHLDPVALLITGHRLASSLFRILVDETTILETAPPIISTTTSPTSSPTEAIVTNTPTEKVADSPTLSPTLNPTDPKVTSSPTSSPIDTPAPITPAPTPEDTVAITMLDNAASANAAETAPSDDDDDDYDDDDDDDYDDDDDDAFDDKIENEFEMEIEEEKKEERIHEEHMIELDSFLVIVIVGIIVGINVVCCGGVWAYDKCQRKMMARSMFDFQKDLHGSKSTDSSRDGFDDEEKSGLISSSSGPIGSRSGLRKQQYHDPLSS